MKQMTAKKEHSCASCGLKIEWQSQYYCTAYNDYCLTCGENKLKNKNQGVKKSTTCKHCDKVHVGVIHGVPVCDAHAGLEIKAP